MRSLGSRSAATRLTWNSAAGTAEPETPAVQMPGA
jgi:hypothetical protein